MPLAFTALLSYAYLTLPKATIPTSLEDSENRINNLEQTSDDGRNIVSGSGAVAKVVYDNSEKDVAEGYFAVCREYVPGGINGKPPVRTTPAGSAIAAESPSVYQSMYRSLFDRKAANSADSAKGETGKASKRARNIFYVVLRHGHLMLYDDSEQLEVRHVISLAHHDVSIYGGEYEIPEGELWIKRNAIALRRKAATQDQGSITLPFFFFSENCSEKEDFYFALLRSQDHTHLEDDAPPQVQHFEVKDIISLVQRLHSSEEHLQTRWINALVGRLFLAIHKTQTAEDFLRMKITKKIARVSKPAFLSNITLNRISLGDSAPFITNPRLRDLTVEGEYCAEAHIKYEGNFRIEIATTVKIDLGPRFKVREVDLVLAVVVKKLEGQLLVRLKPPPSNRIWIAFESMPQLELSIEPIVSSRQITYNIILRAIESKIREVVAETIVLPYWDDTPFLDTIHDAFRGGIWTNMGAASKHEQPTAIPDETAADDDPGSVSIRSKAPLGKAFQDDRSASTPVLVESRHQDGAHRRGHSLVEPSITASNDSVSSGYQRAPEVPKVMRSRSFAAADPVVSTSIVNSDASKPAQQRPRQSKDAASFMTEISNRSQPSSPIGSPSTAPKIRVNDQHGKEKFHDRSRATSIDAGITQLNHSEDSVPAHDTEQRNGPSDGNEQPLRTPNSPNPQQGGRFQNLAKSLTAAEKKPQMQAVMSAANAAKNWGWSTLNRKGKGLNGNAKREKAGTPENPLGRGRPLPPPGEPLPLPESRRGLVLPKRKPVPPSSTTWPIRENPKQSQRAAEKSLPQESSQEAKDSPGNLLVVEAPLDAESTSSVDEEDQDGYGEFMDSFTVDDDDDDEEIKESLVDAIPVSPATQQSVKDSESSDSRSISEGSRPTSFSASLQNENGHALASWHRAEEEETRSESVWMEGHQEQ